MTNTVAKNATLVLLNRNGRPFQERGFPQVGQVLLGEIYQVLRFSRNLFKMYRIGPLHVYPGIAEYISGAFVGKILGHKNLIDFSAQRAISPHECL